jgi:hypothetical protein
MGDRLAPLHLEKRFSLKFCNAAIDVKKFTSLLSDSAGSKIRGLKVSSLCKNSAAV